MERWSNQSLDTQFHRDAVQADVKAFFSGVYSYMFLGLSISGMVSWYLASSGLFLQWFINVSTGTVNPLFYVVTFSPLAFIFIINAKYEKFSKGVLVLLFVIFSTLMGASFSSIFFIYSIGSISSTFFIAAGLFGCMALLGYTTSVDLTKMGSLLYMVFIGIFIASIVNMFLNSDTMSYIISFIGVFVFTGLTAWEMQRLKAIATDPAIDAETKEKLSLIGGMSLYILFINLFLSLLRLFGGRD